MISSIDDPAVIKRILEYPNMRAEVGRPLPPLASRAPAVHHYGNLYRRPHPRTIRLSKVSTALAARGSKKKMAEEETKERWPVALVIAAVPALSYLSAYQFERGYLSYFQLPSNVIRISLELTIANMIGLFAIFISFFYIVNALVAFATKAFDHPHWVVRRAATVHIAMIGFCILVAKAYGWKSGAMLGCIVALLVMDVVIFLPALLSRSKTPWYERVGASLESDPFRDAYDRLHSWIGSRAFFSITTAILIVFCASYFAGRATARNTREFDVTEDMAQVLVRQYGTSSLLKGIDVANRRVLNAFSVLTAEEMDKLRFQRIRLSGVAIDSPLNPVAEAGENSGSELSSQE